jgi:enoyl-CoA hydratase/carnithine racemase
VHRPRDRHGAFLLLSGDYRVGAAGPYKIRANDVAIGLVMPFFGVEICRPRLAPAHFQRVVINSEQYDPEGAVAAGFLDRIVPPAELHVATLAKALELARLDFDVHAATKLRARFGAEIDPRRHRGRRRRIPPVKAADRPRSRRDTTGCIVLT